MSETKQNNLIQGRRVEIFEFVSDENIKAYDSPTNGSIFLKTYPDSQFANIGYDDGVCCVYVDLGGSRIRFTSDWWNATYNKEEENERNVKKETEFYIKDGKYNLGVPFETEKEVYKFLYENKKWFTEIVFGKWDDAEIKIVKKETVITEEKIKAINSDFFKEGDDANSN